MVAGFARGLADAPGAPWPQAFLRELAGSACWHSVAIKKALDRGRLARKFPDEIAGLHKVVPWPQGAMSSRDLFMGHSRQKALAWCLGGAVACAWPSGAPDGIADSLADRFALRLDRVNAIPAVVFRSAWSSRAPR